MQLLDFTFVHLPVRGVGGKGQGFSCTVSCSEGLEL